MQGGARTGQLACCEWQEHPQLLYEVHRRGSRRAKPKQMSRWFHFSTCLRHETQFYLHPDGERHRLTSTHIHLGCYLVHVSMAS